MSKLFEQINKVQETRQARADQETVPPTLKTLPPRDRRLVPSFANEPLTFFILGLCSGILLSGLASYLLTPSSDNTVASTPVIEPAPGREATPPAIKPGTKPLIHDEKVLALVTEYKKAAKQEPARAPAEQARPPQAKPSPSSKPGEKTTPTVPGRYPTASERLLAGSDLRGIPKSELKLMRNEIFARHGYIFQSKKMSAYFKGQEWYSAQHKNVSNLLTETEKQNIELIRRAEKQAP